MADIKITFIRENGEKIEVMASEGQTLLELARDQDINIEGSCGGSCACATCHVWIEDPWAPKLPSISDAENNMLDNAMQGDYRSRLCCQIIVTPELDGMEVKIPRTTEAEPGSHHHH